MHQALGVSSLPLWSMRKKARNHRESWTTPPPAVAIIMTHIIYSYPNTVCICYLLMFWFIFLIIASAYIESSFQVLWIVYKYGLLLMLLIKTFPFHSIKEWKMHFLPFQLSNINIKGRISILGLCTLNLCVICLAVSHRTFIFP